MPHRVPLPDPHLPPPGERAGEGSESLLPFLRQRRAANPRRANDFVPTEPGTGAGESPQDDDAR